MANTWGDYSSEINVNELTEIARHNAQPTKAFSQIAGAPVGKALGKGKGDSVKYTFWPDLDTAGGVLSETETVPTTTLTPVDVTYTLDEIGNATSYTDKLESLSRLTIEDQFMVALMNDYNKVRNTLARTAAALTDWEVMFNSSADVFVTNGTATAAQNEDFSLANLRFMKKQAKKNNIPFFDGESYAVVTGEDALDALESDSSLTAMLQEDSGRAALNGEIGRVASCRLISDTHAITQTTGTYDEVFLFGADGIAYDVACPVEIRMELSDLQRQTVVGWIEISKYYKVLDQTDHGREHIIHSSST